MIVAVPTTRDETDLVSPSRLNCLDQLREELSCAVCLDVCVRPCTTACGHNFCLTCLGAALAHDWQKRCPKCRVALPHRGQHAVNTTLWNTIQMLFPGVAVCRPEPPAAQEPGLSPQALRADQQEPERPRTAAALAVALPHAPPPVPVLTGLDDLLAALSLDAVATPSPRIPDAGNSSHSAPQDAPLPRPWARIVAWPAPPQQQAQEPGSNAGFAAAAAAAAATAAATAAAGQTGQPGVIPVGLPSLSQHAAAAAGLPRPANPFARTAAAAGHRERASSQPSSRSSSRASSPERPAAGASALPVPAVAAAAAIQAAAAAAAVVDLTVSEDENEDAEQHGAPESAALQPAGAGPAAVPAQPTSTRRGLAVSVPEQLVLGEEDENTPPAQIMPMHSANPSQPAAPQRKRAASRLAPSPLLVHGY